MRKQKPSIDQIDKLVRYTLDNEKADTAFETLFNNLQKVSLDEINNAGTRVQDKNDRCIAADGIGGFIIKYNDIAVEIDIRDGIILIRDTANLSGDRGIYSAHILETTDKWVYWLSKYYTIKRRI